MKGQEEEYRYQVIPISVANNSAVNTLTEASVQLDRDYDKITGLAYHEIASGGAAANNYQVGVKTSRKQWVDPVNINNWRADTGVPPDLKFRRMNIPYASGDSFYVQIINGAITNAALQGELVMRLEKSLTELPR